MSPEMALTQTGWGAVPGNFKGECGHHGPFAGDLAPTEAYPENNPSR